MLLFIWSILVYRSTALFPGAVPDEGDIRHLYPIRQIVIGLEDHAHVLPYIVGWLENLEYPKSRLHIEFYVNGKEDSTGDQLVWWKSSIKGLFKSLSIKKDDENWLESGLRSARLKKANSVFIFSGNTLPTESKMFKYLDFNKTDVVVCPVFSPFLEGEPWNNPLITEDNVSKLEKDERFKIEKLSLPMHINLNHLDSSYLTFDFNNIINYEGSTDDIEVFSSSAERMGINILLDNSHYYGVFLSDTLDLDDHRKAIRYYLSNLVANDIKLPLVSRSVRSWTADPELPKGLDKVYLINLKRRADRLERMNKIFSILGVDYSVLEASDGKNLPTDIKFKVMPGYADPFHKRPIKSGEIGCFLSHYRIWKDVVDNNLKQVLVFEDDLRFSMNGIERIVEVLEDLKASRMDWDLIYVGRKKQAVDQEELWVPEHRHLSSVGYSYWTLGYLLSLSGAKKLLAAKPLDNLLPVDEYIPIMFDRHPNEEWKSFFPERNLNAFTLFPLSVFPQRYTTDPGYVSDTEDSTIVTSASDSVPDITDTKDEL